jgi:hypothetical protein
MTIVLRCHYLCISRNSLSPHYINIATTRYNVGATTQPSPKENKENREIEDEKEKKVMLRRRVDENEDDPQSLRLSENSTTLLARRALHIYQAAPSRRDARMTTLLPEVFLGFPPVCRGVWGWYTRCPSRRNGGARGRHCVGAGIR